jgi:aminoglycoside phosphotransferase (APT) family kinase protein
MTEIDAALVEGLIRTQFPQWAELPVAPVENGGWDNTTFRLGDTMSVRLPSALPYVAQVEKEHRWLPVLRPHLPLPIPVPLGLWGSQRGLSLALVDIRLARRQTGAPGPHP